MRCIHNNNELHELTLEELQTFSALVSEDIFKFLTIEQMIQRRKSHGGTAAENVAAAVDAAEKQPET
jgi:argininosuccinate lyase